jgi:cell division septum initiation protein DivIVA
MPIDPEAITPAGLPRSFHGYDREATDDLLKRVAWDYRQLVNECRKLREAAEPYPSRQPALRPGGDEVARTLVAAAHRAAKELRESARSDCEAMLKKARARAHELEAEGRHRAEHAAADTAQLQQAAAALRAQLSAALQVALGEQPAPADAETPVG